MEENQYHKELERCVRCGACKATCPTYLEELDECLSARGRLAMLHAFETGKLGNKKNKGLMEKLFSCVLCGACEKRCSPGIKIQDIFYYGRQKFSHLYTRNHILAGLTKLALSNSDTTAACFRGIQHIAELSPLAIDSLGSLPRVAKIPFLQRKQKTQDTWKNKKAAVFTGCAVNFFYPHLGESLVSVLNGIGYQAIVFPEEVCCGAPLRSLGLEEEAVKYQEKNLKLLNGIDYDVIVTLCPTCTFSLKTANHKNISMILDINEFLAQETMELALKNQQSVVYHDPCHLKNSLKVFKEPRTILSNIRGLKLVEAEEDGCCGYGGLFRIQFPELSKKIGQKRLAVLQESGVTNLVTSCPGCIIQFEEMARELQSHIRVRHIIEVIDEALEKKEKLRFPNPLPNTYS